MLVKLRYCVLISFLLLLFFFITENSFAQETEVPVIKSNADIMTSHIGEQLKISEIVLNLDAPFRVSAQFPDRNMTYLFDVLLGLGKTIKQVETVDYIELRLFPQNTLTQINRLEAQRSIFGELHILKYSYEAVLQQTEVMNFSYSDVISLSDIDVLESSWNGARFHNKELLRERNLWKQVGQPAIIAVATGVTVFLLFNVRGS